MEFSKGFVGCLQRFLFFARVAAGEASPRSHANPGRDSQVNKLTLAASWDVRVATFSWDASNSRRSFLICWFRDKKKKKKKRGIIHLKMEKYPAF